VALVSPPATPPPLERRAAVASAIAKETATTERSPPVKPNCTATTERGPPYQRSVALHIIRKHARTGAHKLRRKGLLLFAKGGDWLISASRGVR